MLDNYIYKPLEVDVREKKLREFLKNGESFGNIKIPRISGIDKNSLKIYRIPLEYLVYNPHNKRFATRAKTLEKRFGELNSDNPEHIKSIEKFLWDYKKEKNDSTISSLIDNGQLEAGVVTVDGVILAGNRRFRLLNEIRRNPDKYHAPVDRVGYFEAAIIDKKLDKKQILKFESFFQYGQDEKVDYGPIEKYLAVNEQKEEGFSVDEIYKNFQAIADKKKKVEEWLEAYVLMNKYLDHIQEPGIYTALEKREEHFLSLNGQLKQLRRGTSATVRGIWAYDESDIAEFEIVAFDYIHRYVPVETFRRLFKIFQNENNWKTFYKRHKELMSEIKIESLDDYRSKSSAQEEEELSATRQNDFVEAAKQVDFDRELKVQINILDEVELESKPIDILKKIASQIDKFKDSLIKSRSSHENEEVVELLNVIQKEIGHLKQDLD